MAKPRVYSGQTARTWQKILAAAQKITTSPAILATIASHRDNAQDRVDADNAPAPLAASSTDMRKARRNLTRTTENADAAARIESFARRSGMPDDVVCQVSSTVTFRARMEYQSARDAVQALARPKPQRGGKPVLTPDYLRARREWGDALDRVTFLEQLRSDVRESRRAAKAWQRLVAYARKGAVAPWIRQSVERQARLADVALAEHRAELAEHRKFMRSIRM